MIKQFQIKDKKITFFNRNIICDLDDVLGDFAPTMNKHMNRISSLQLSVEHYLTYNYYDRHDLTAEQFDSIIEDESVFLKMPIKEGAIEGLQALIDKGFIIHIVTARGRYGFSQSQTKQWLEQNKVPYHHVHIVNTAITPKSEIYNAIAGGAACLIDDAPYNIIDAMDCAPGLLPIIINQPWNASFQGIQHWEFEYHGFRFDSVKDFADNVELLSFDGIKSQNHTTEAA